MTDIVQRLRERQADMAETIERLDTSEFDTGGMGQIRAEQYDLYREAADEIDRLRAAVQHEADCVEAAKVEIDRLTRELAHEEQRVADMMADMDRVGRERDEARAGRDALRAALHTCLWAMRQPLDGWKGDCERKAMDKANAALAQIEQERSEQTKDAEARG